MSEFRKRIIEPLLLPIAAAGFIGLLVFSFSRILLAVPETGSTTIAMLMAAEILGVAAVLSAGARLKPAQRLLLLAIGIGLISGGGASAKIGIREIEKHTEAVVLSAANLKFSSPTLRIPSDAEVAMKFSNNDSAPHNVKITRDSTQADVLFDGEVITGGTVITYELPPLPQGTYFFLCKVHPNIMTGDLIARTSGPETSVDIVAKGIAFDLTEFKLKAGTVVTVSFDNQDAGIPHNVVITPVEGDLSKAIFREDFFPGPASREWTFGAPAAGNYFFFCEVHPNMKGTAVFQ